MASNTPRPTKAERRAAARAKAKALREEQERRERRAKITRRSLLGAATVVVVGAGAGLVVYSRKNTVVGNSFPGVAEADGSVTFGAPLTPGTSNDGAPVLDVFFDYSCHFCAAFDTLHTEEITTLLRDGRITLALRPCKILGQNWTDIVMNGMGLVLDQQPDTALDFHNAAFSLFSEIYNSQDGNRLTVDELASTAKSTGVSGSIVDAFNKTVKDNSYGTWTETGTGTFKDKGLQSTPTVLLDGTQLDLQTLSTETALTEAVDGLAGDASGTPAPGDDGQAPAEGGAASAESSSTAAG